MVKHRLESTDVFHQRCHGLEQTSDVPRTDVGLIPVAVASAACVGGVGCPIHIEGLEPSVRAVIDGDAVNGHVVGVHHAVNETDAHPVGDHGGRGFSDLGQPSDHAVVGGDVVVGEVMANGVVNQCSKGLVVPVGHVDLETPEPNEARCHSANDRSGFGRRDPVVEDIPDDLFAGGDQRKGARGGHAEMMHCFAAEEFTNR